MATQTRQPVYAPALSPFPEGWFFVATRRAIEKAGLLQKTWMGESVVAWCDDDGRVCVAEARCPHLGSDLGPAAGARVRDGRLVCPFHGFEYDATGQCVATPYADPPRTARLRVFATQEIAGLVFGWWGIGGREPQWRLPAEPMEEAGWSYQDVRTVRFPGHPQETTENSVDMAHLRYVHGYHNTGRVGGVLMDGPYLESNFDFRTKRRIAKLATLTFDVSARTEIYGLGYSFVNIRERSIGLDMRMWVLVTPVDGTLIDLSLVSQVRTIRGPRRRIVGLGFLPPGLRAPLMNKFMSSFQLKDVKQDVVIWGRKRYQPRPRLSRSDGEIMPFRAWCAQFYPNPQDAEDPPPPKSGGAVQPAIEEVETVTGRRSALSGSPEEEGTQ